MTTLRVGYLDCQLFCDIIATFSFEPGLDPLPFDFKGSDFSLTAHKLPEGGLILIGR